MKDLITSIASVLILTMFLLQFTANQVTFTKIMGAEHAIREFRLISENKGIIRSESIAQLKGTLADVLSCSTGEITVNVPGDMIDSENKGSEAKSTQLEVTMPVYGVIGPAGVIGISPEQNVRIHTSQSIIVIPPKPENTPETEESQK